MRVFRKNLIKIAGIALLAGIILMIAGFSMDTTIFERPEDFSYNIGGKTFGNKVGYWFEEKETIENAKEETTPNSSYSDDMDWDEDYWDEEWEDSWEEYDDREDMVSQIDEDTKAMYSDSLNYPISYKKVDSLDLDISSGAITIKEGDTFSIDVIGVGKDYIKSELTDGIWRVTDSGYFNVDKDDEVHTLNIFGVKIRTDKNNISWQGTTKIEITLPKDFKAEDLRISIGTGAVKADSLTAKTAMVNVGAGSIRIDKLTVANASGYSVGAGELVIKDFTGKDVDLDCAVGSITLSGIIKGDNDINCGIGSVEMNVTGNEEDYNYEISSSIGSIQINNNKYTGITSDNIKNSGAKDSFSLECDIGKIDLNIR